MTKPILIAGILGGILGGVVSFAASRWIKPADTPKPRLGAIPTEVPEAREVAEAFVAKLRAAKIDEFAEDARRASSPVTNEKFAEWKQKLTQDRERFGAFYGPPSFEFELLRETALSPSVVRCVYLEKYPRGGVIWQFILYRTKTGDWMLALVDWNDSFQSAFSGI